MTKFEGYGVKHERKNPIVIEFELTVDGYRALLRSTRHSNYLMDN